MWNQYIDSKLNHIHTSFSGIFEPDLLLCSARGDQPIVFSLSGLAIALTGQSLHSCWKNINIFNRIIC